MVGVFELYVRNSLGERLDICPSDSYQIDYIDGLTPAGASISSVDFAGADGASVSGSRIGVRNVVMAILPRGDVGSARVALYRFLRPRESVTIGFRNDVREAEIDGMVETFEGSLFEAPETLTVSVLCPQPYWRDAARIVDEIASSLRLFEFPFSIEDEGIPFSSIREVLQIEVENSGETETGLYVVLRSSGEASNPVLYDATRRTYFAVQVDMHAADEVVIDTRRGSKGVRLVRDGVSTNLINRMDPGSTWLQLPVGVTEFALDADSGADYVSAEIYHDTLFQGV